jgi:hypothetical protein
VRRLLACAVAVAAALGVVAPVRGGTVAATDCVALRYTSGINAAVAALDARPPDVGAARARILAAQQDAAPDAAILTPVIDDLNSTPPDVGDARTRLQALAGVLAVPPGSTCNVDSSAARQALRDVYASPVFANLDQSSQPSLFSRILDFLGGLIDAIRRTLGTGGSLLLAAAVIAGALALAAWRLRRGLGSRPAHLRDEPAGDSDDPDVEWKAATTAAARGDYREAIRRAFRSALLDIALRGTARVDPAWTTRELLGSLAADGDLLAALAPAAGAFDYAWYSGNAIGSDLWLQAKARCEALRSMVRKRAPGGVT